MKLIQIELDDEELPSGATLRVSADEALYLALLLGKMNGVQAEELMTGGANVSSEMHSCLSNGLFNRFYDDGVSDAARLHG